MTMKRLTITDTTLEGLGQQIALVVKARGWTRGRWRSRMTTNGKTFGTIYQQDVEVPEGMLTRQPETGATGADHAN